MNRNQYLNSIVGISVLAALSGLVLGAQNPKSSITNPESSIKEDVPLKVTVGVPLRVALDKPVLMKKGELVEGTLVEPIYVFDRVVVPPGVKILGHVERVYSVGGKYQRTEEIMGGNFTPPRQAVVQFDTLVMGDGKQVPLSTAVSPGATHVVHLVSNPGHLKKKDSALRSLEQQAEQQVEGERKIIKAAVKTPGKLQRLKAVAVASLPYHKPALPVGMRFDAELEQPLEFGTASCPLTELGRLGSLPADGGIVHARLVTPLSSASAHEGMPVTAVISQPVFDKNHQLILPEGTLLKGSVIRAKAARRFDRDGKLRFTFQKIQLPSGLVKQITSSLAGVEVSSDTNIQLGPEGGAGIKKPKSHYIMPAIDVTLAAATAHDEDNAATLSAPSGILGFGIMGAVMGLVPSTVAAPIGIYGAAKTVYTHFIARGHDVVFPKDTRMEILFGLPEWPTPRS